MRIFIYGSCVSRDAFTGSSASSVVEYVARSGAGSAFAPEPEAAEPDYERNPSPFQQRMVRYDWTKKLPDLLDETDFDVLLVDLIDERLGLSEVGGSLITVSPELVQMGFDPRENIVHPFGSEAHDQAFSQGLSALRDRVPAEKIVLSKVLWAERLNNGQDAGSLPLIQAANRTLRARYEVMESVGIRTIEYPSELLVGDAKHKWGASPFHYVPEFYDATIKGLNALAHL